MIPAMYYRFEVWNNDLNKEVGGIFQALGKIIPNDRYSYYLEDIDQELPLPPVRKLKEDFINKYYLCSCDTKSYFTEYAFNRYLPQLERLMHYVNENINGYEIRIIKKHISIDDDIVFSDQYQILLIVDKKEFITMEMKGWNKNEM